MYPLVLQAKLGAWQIFAARRSDPAFQSFAKKIWERDQYVCQYCGFQAQEYQEVVNIDHDYQRNVKSNLITACCFCSQCLFIEAVSRNEYGGGTLIHLPELTQNELNALAHVLFCAMNNATAYQGSAQTIYRSFKFRAQTIEEQYGAGTSKPAFLGQLLLESKKVNDQIKTDVLADMRLLPSHARFRTQIEAWAATAVNEIPS